MRIEVRNDSILIDGYVNAVGRDSRPILDKKTGERFIEQIVPGAFKRAIQQNEVQLLLDHDETRVLGSTETNLKLFEDNIGLRAIAEITDAEVIQKAKENKLRGWSFGFLELAASEEDSAKGLKRRYVEEMKLKEVSLIDEKRVPCYIGTSVETRAEGEEVVEPDVLETRAMYTEVSQEQPVDLDAYKNRIKKLEEKE